MGKNITDKNILTTPWHFIINKKSSSSTSITIIHRIWCLQFNSYNACTQSNISRSLVGSPLLYLNWSHLRIELFELMTKNKKMKYWGSTNVKHWPTCACGVVDGWFTCVVVLTLPYMMASLRLTVCRASEVSGRLTRCDIRLIGSWVDKRQKLGEYVILRASWSMLDSNWALLTARERHACAMQPTLLTSGI